MSIFIVEEKEESKSLICVRKKVKFSGFLYNSEEERDTFKIASLSDILKQHRSYRLKIFFYISLSKRYK